MKEMQIQALDIINSISTNKAFDLLMSYSHKSCVANYITSYTDLKFGLIKHINQDLSSSNCGLNEFIRHFA